MEDKVITIIFGSLSATLALVSILFAYLQLRGFRSTVGPDEEQVVPLDVVAHAEPIPNRQYSSSPVAFLPLRYHQPNNTADKTLHLELLHAVDRRETLLRIERSRRVVEWTRFIGRE